MKIAIGSTVVISKIIAMHQVSKHSHARVVHSPWSKAQATGLPGLCDQFHSSIAARAVRLTG
jgi:hypothetical protein